MKEPLYLIYRDLWKTASKVMSLKRENKLSKETENKVVEILTEANKKLEELLKESESIS
jgi:hypothetical protein